MKSYIVHFIRHATTEGNFKGQYIGVTDLPITTNGIMGLEELRKQDVYPDVNAFYSSPMLRCRQTIEKIYPGCNPVIIDDLKEYDFGDFEGKTAFELEKTPEYTEWTSGRALSPPGGESTADFTARVCVGLREVVENLMKSGNTEGVVVTHGGVIMTLLAACALPRQPLYSWMCSNGRGYTIRITPSLYQRSGVVEVIGEIPLGEANPLKL